MLTQERLRRLLHYDPETGIFTKLRTGQVVQGSLSAGRYLRVGIDCKRYDLHRLAFLYMTGSWPTEQVDHRNLRTLDNRWANLRQASCSQNQANVLNRMDNKSGVKGVSYEKRSGKWTAQIAVRGKRKRLGYFETVEAGKAAYIAASREYFGEFSRSS